MDWETGILVYLVGFAVLYVAKLIEDYGFVKRKIERMRRQS